MLHTPDADHASRNVFAVTTIVGDKVKNSAGEDLGTIEEIMLDLESGEVAYAVLSFGGFLGMGNKLFAVPWEALDLNLELHEITLNADKATLENAPGFDKDNWPDFADSAFGTQIQSYYQRQPGAQRSTNVASIGKGMGMGMGAETAVRTETDRDVDVARERLNQPDLPQELRRRPIDVMDFPGRQADADLKTADATHTYSVNDTNRWTRR